MMYGWFAHGVPRPGRVRAARDAPLAPIGTLSARSLGDVPTDWRPTEAGPRRAYWDDTGFDTRVGRCIQHSGRLSYKHSY